MENQQNFERLYKYFKENNAITLVALVVTIVVLIILATISINIIFGEEGILEKAKQAKQDMANAEAQEQKILEDTTNSMDQYVTGEREQITYGYEPNSLTDALVSLTYSTSTTEIPIGTRTLSDFSSVLSVNDESYLKYNSTTGNLEVQKDGLYMINVDGNAYYNSDSAMFTGDLVLNGKNIFLGYIWIDSSTARGKIGKCTTVYLKKGETINISISNEGIFTHYNIKMSIYAN